MSVVHPTFIRTYADYLDWVATSPEAIVVGPFRILPNVDPYNYRQLDGYRMHGHCHHLRWSYPVPIPGRCGSLGCPACSQIPLALPGPSPAHPTTRGVPGSRMLHPCM